MQRITRDATAFPPELLNTLDAKVSLLRRYFPPSIANLFASPRADQGGLQWWSELGGQPQPYATLPATEQQALLKRYDQRQQAISLLADELAGQGKHDESASLRSLIGPANLNDLYSLNGEPVVIRWGLPEPQPAAPAGATPKAPASTPPRTSTPRPRRTWRIPLWWLLLPLLLLLLALLLWFWRGYLWNLANPGEMTSYACSPGAAPPDFVVVLDTSGSMNLNINASAEDEDWLYSFGDALPDSNPRKARILSEPTRMNIAKEAFGDMLEHLHTDIETRLLTFDGCYATIDHGRFPDAERQKLEQGVQHLQARNGTPLADSLETAASMVDGRFHDALVVMFVDGEDGCGKNICEVSERIAHLQPRLRVNIVNISDSELSNCVAQNTGGRVYNTRDSEELRSMLREASEEVSASASCAKPL